MRRRFWTRRTVRFAKAKWNSIPIPVEDHVDEHAASLLLSSGEVLPIRNVSRCAISEVHYEFDLVTE